MTQAFTTNFFTHYVRRREQLPLRTRVVFTVGAVVLLHLAALGLLLTAVAPGAQPLALGVVLTAYVAGMKHSYDWDHIAAIDNSTRKFVSEGRNPASVGFAFSLGHSMVVTLAGVMVIAGAQFVHGAFEEGSTANLVLGLIGAGVSGLYLLILGLFNSGIAWRLIRRIRTGDVVSEGLPAQGADETWGLISRLLRKPLSKVRRPRDIFVIGFLFGLGFDTATTIGLLLLTASASLAGVPALALLGLPLAFTAAMTLCDTINGLGMMRLYSSAIADGMTRIRFNASVTAVSSVAALGISVLTLGGFVHDLFDLDDPMTTWMADADLGDAGLVLVGCFVVLWVGFVAAHRRQANRLEAMEPATDRR